MLISPFLAKCTDRRSKPLIHPRSGAPDDWFSDKMLFSHNFLGLTFDFFVDWSKRPPALTPVIWIKKILDPAYTYSDFLKSYSVILTNHFGNSSLNLLNSIRKQYSLTVRFIILRDDQNWSEEKSNILIVTFLGKANNGFAYTVDDLNIKEFKKTIQSHSGGPVQVGVKGLTYSTTNLECYLSKTNSLYPGDVDLILFNHQYEPLAIIEYKKHTLNSSITDQKLSNYYPNQDGRKYNRLSILRDYLGNKDHKLPLINIYYPTNPLCSQGRMELIKGTTGTLQTNVISNFPLPKSEFEYEGVLNKLKKAIVHHHSIREV